MTGHNNFAALRRSATKVYKFSQGKSLALLDPAKAVHAGAMNMPQFTIKEFAGIKGGICASLAADWLREKLVSERHGAFTGKSAGPDVHAEKNLATVIGNVPKFVDYQKHASPKGLLALYGLEPSLAAATLRPMVSGKQLVEHSMLGRDGRQHISRTYELTPQFVESVINACGPDFLAKRRGVYVGLSVISNVADKEGGGHAVAAYRSKGNTLYFFDPNCGVYDVTAPAAFFADFFACYTALGYTLAFQPQTRFDGFTYVDR